MIPRTPASRPSLVSVGTIVWLSSELMFFAGLFAMYFTIRAVDKGMGKHWPMAHLDLPLATTNTIVLLLSSVTCQLGVFAVERGQIRRVRLDLQRGQVGTARVVRAVVPDGPVLRLRPGLRVPRPVRKQHVTHLGHQLRLGLLPDHRASTACTSPAASIAFLFLLGRTFAAKKFTHEQQVSAIVVSYYWHFVDVVWIGLFTTIYLIH